MMKFASAALMAALLLSACVTAPPQLGPDGKPLPEAYVIRSRRCQSRDLFDGGFGQCPQGRQRPVAIAARRSADRCGRHPFARHVGAEPPWHFGSDGSSPILRVQRTGYPGKMLGENISETYENEVETLTAWMSVPDTRAVVLDATRDEDRLFLVSGTFGQALVDAGHRKLIA